MKILFFRLLDSFFLMRPVVLVPVWGFALFGYYRGKNPAIADSISAWKHPEPGPLFLILAFSISVGCVYVLNQIADIEVDRKNGGLPLLASGIVSRVQAWVIALIAALASMLIPIISGHGAIALLSATAITIGLAYSFKPTFFSGRPFLDFLTNAAGFGVIAFGCGWQLAGRPILCGSFLFAALPYFLLMCAGSISSTVPDIKGDRESGKRTTAVLLGGTNAQILAALFIAGAAVSSLFLRDHMAAWCSISALPLYFLYFARPNRLFEEATYKIGGLVCMAAAALFSPLFIACCMAVLLGTWAYFRFRHGVAYPSLVPVRPPLSTPSTAATP
jgi:4-hydroxybenzoate polyprenyltransferase